MQRRRVDRSSQYPSNYSSVAFYHMDCIEYCMNRILFPGRIHHSGNYNCWDTPCVDNTLLVGKQGRATIAVRLLELKLRYLEIVTNDKVLGLTGISVFAHTSWSWILNWTIPIEAAIVFAIKDATILADEWRCTLAGAESIAYTLWLSRENHQLVIFESTWNFYIIANVIIAAMCAVLVVIDVVVADGARTCYIWTVHAIISWVTFAKAVGADSVPTTVVCAIVHVQHPQCLDSPVYRCACSTPKICSCVRNCACCVPVLTSICACLWSWYMTGPPKSEGINIMSFLDELMAQPPPRAPPTQHTYLLLATCYCYPIVLLFLSR